MTPYSWAGRPLRRSANHILNIVDLYVYSIALDCNKVSILIKSVYYNTFPADSASGKRPLFLTCTEVLSDGGPDRGHSYLGSLYFSGENREEEWWSCYAPQNSAAPTAEESGEGSGQGKGIYKSVRQEMI